MTNEIIYIQDYALIVSDEQAKENDWGYIPFEGGQVKLIGKFFADDWRKVIGYRPLNHSAWILEGVPLLPDFGLGDDVEGLAEKEYYEQSKSFEDSLVDPIFDTSRFSVVGFIDGYNKAKETYKYTQGNIMSLVQRVHEIYSDGLGVATDSKLQKVIDFVESLQQPKLPNTFECEMTQLLPNESFGLDYGSYNLKPKTITNSQGQTELVGEYIY